MGGFAATGHFRNQEDWSPFFTLPGTQKLLLPKPILHFERNPATGAQIKRPAKMVVKMVE